MKVSFHVHIIRFDLGRSSPPLLTFFVSFSADEAGVQQKKKKITIAVVGKGEEEGGRAEKEGSKTQTKQMKRNG